MLVVPPKKLSGVVVEAAHLCYCDSPHDDSHIADDLHLPSSVLEAIVSYGVFGMFWDGNGVYCSWKFVFSGDRRPPP